MSYTPISVLSFCYIFDVFKKLCKPKKIGCPKKSLYTLHSQSLLFYYNLVGLFFSVTGEISGGFGRADSDEDDGPMIPDLDDVQDEDMALQVKWH